MSRRATIRTEHEDPELLARALRPDNTDEMETIVTEGGDSGSDPDERGAVVTRIERETTGGLHSNVDDYVVNLEVAMNVAEQARVGQHDQPTDTGPVSDTDTTTSTHNE